MGFVSLQRGAATKVHFFFKISVFQILLHLIRCKMRNSASELFEQIPFLPDTWNRYSTLCKGYAKWQKNKKKVGSRATAVTATARPKHTTFRI